MRCYGFEKTIGLIVLPHPHGGLFGGRNAFFPTEALLFKQIFTELCKNDEGTLGGSLKQTNAPKEIPFFYRSAV